jgi:hypothetical protein
MSGTDFLARRPTASGPDAETISDPAAGIPFRRAFAQA